MRLWITIIVLSCLWSNVGSLHAAGPQADPEKYADYGGTPDLVMSGDIQLSTEELENLLAKLGSESLKDRIDAAAEIRQNAPGAETVYRAALWRSGNVSHRQIKEVMKSASGAGDAGGERQHHAHRCARDHLQRHHAAS